MPHSNITKSMSRFHNGQFYNLQSGHDCRKEEYREARMYQWIVWVIRWLWNKHYMAVPTSPFLQDPGPVCCGLLVDVEQGRARYMRRGVPWLKDSESHGSRLDVLKDRGECDLQSIDASDRTMNLDGDGPCWTSLCWGARFCLTLPSLLKWGQIPHSRWVGYPVTA